jgi:hypothetical protein
MRIRPEQRVSIDELRAALDYDPSTGRFTWKISPTSFIKAGTPADCVCNPRKPYIRIAYKQARILAHRIAWAFVHGRWPEGQIDHINGNHSDNRIENLREVTQSVNCQNQRRAKRQNRTGLLGVSPSKWGAYIAQINIRGERTYLGTFKTAEEAHQAYVKAKRAHHEGCVI